MSRYRKIDPRFWKDEKVMVLTTHEKLIALYLFTGQSNRIGLFNFSPGEAAEDLGVSAETILEGFLKPFGNVCRSLNFGWDKTFRVLYLPTWWKYNCPENPNVLKACLADLHEIPQTPLLKEFSSNLIYLPETFHQTFREGLGKPSPQRMPDQEQEQEQEKKQEKENRTGDPSLSPDRVLGNEQQDDVSKKKQTKRTRKTPAIPINLKPIVSRIVARMNELSGAQFKDDAPGSLDYLVARLQDGATDHECLAVVEHRWCVWGSNPEMIDHFDPKTLFRKSNFSRYLAKAQRVSVNGNGAIQPPRKLLIP